MVSSTHIMKVSFDQKQQVKVKPWLIYFDVYYMFVFVYLLLLSVLRNRLADHVQTVGTWASTLTLNGRP